MKNTIPTCVNKAFTEQLAAARLYAEPSFVNWMRLRGENPEKLGLDLLAHFRLQFEMEEHEDETDRWQQLIEDATQDGFTLAGIDQIENARW
jgi:hypothetical protein